MRLILALSLSIQYMAGINRSHLLACVTQDVNKGTIPEFCF